jgi:exosortase
MSVTARNPLWRVLAVSAAIVFAYATVLNRLGQHWWIDENYSHGLLIPLIIGYILWSQRDSFRKQPVQPSFFLGTTLVLLGLLGLWAGTAGAELYIQRLSFIVVLVGTIIYFWGFRFIRLTAVSFGLLLLAIPIPAIIFNKIAFPLQIFASKCAVWSMRVLDIPVLRQGNVIELIPLGGGEIKKLEVVEACSGIRSLMTLTTLAVVFAYFTHPTGSSSSGGRLGWIKSYAFWRSGLLIFAALPIAIITNAGRVSGTGVLAHYYGTQVADGFFHTFSGWVIYIAAFVMLFAFGWFLDRFKPADSNKARDARAAQTAKVAVPTGNVASVKGAE